MFINFTNHPSHLWSEDQIKAAMRYGSIEDMPFPSVNPFLDTEGVKQLTKEYTRRIIEQNPDVVLVQGEMTLCFHVVELLKKEGIKVLCACSQRISSEETDTEGNTVKKSIFQFVQFREY